MRGLLERAQRPVTGRAATLMLATLLILAALGLGLARRYDNGSFGDSSAAAARPTTASPAGPCAPVQGRSPAGAATTSAADWTRFGYEAGRSDSAPLGLSVAQVGRLARTQVTLDGVADSSPLYLHAVRVSGRLHDVLLLTTLYGRSEALDARSGRLLWRYSPPAYAQLAGSPQITNSTPLVDPSRRYLYTAAPDGCVRALSLADGRLLWATPVARYPLREKLGTALNYWQGHLLATTGGYNGDAPPYQGHVIVLDAQNGRVLHVWNSLCSDRHALIDPATCPSSDSAIWARSGAVVRPDGDILVATGNGPFDGRRDWGDSVILLSPQLRPLASWTPTNQAELDSLDVDLGSTAPALVGPDLIVQGGKDGLLRLIRLARASPLGHLGGELQTVETPGKTDLFSAPAVWRHSGETWLFVGDNDGLAAWRLVQGRLERVWQRPRPATSPVVAQGLLYAFNPAGGLAVYQAASGRLIRVLPSGPGHWQSPLVAGGRVYLTEGNGNERKTSGVLDIYAPGR